MHGFIFCLQHVHIGLIHLVITSLKFLCPAKNNLCPALRNTTTFVHRIMFTSLGVEIAQRSHCLAYEIALLKRTLYIVSQYIPECSLGWQAVTVSVTSRPVLPGPASNFFVVSYKLYTQEQPVMQAGSGSIDTRGLRALRQRQFDTQPSSDSESEHPDLCEVKDSDSKGDNQEEEKSVEAPGQSLVL